MVNSMAKYSQRARRVLAIAQEEAEAFKHDVVGTGHLLLALLREPGGIGGRALRDMGMQAGLIEAAIKRRSTAATHPGRYALSFSDDLQRVMVNAVDVMQAHEQHYVGTEHLLLGMLNIPDCTGCAILREMGHAPNEVQKQIADVMGEPPLTAVMKGRTRAQARLRVLMQLPETAREEGYTPDEADILCELSLNLSEALRLLSDAMQRLDAGEEHVELFTTTQGGQPVQVIVALHDESEPARDG